ncbi:hypothetical protein TIFTF001_005472 [Ficus carica]|uniref:Uncharacterized protein n=1 Tax=Ficus carica TaxID=3494 RepID=A0AA87ZNT7_FICCA|nr:hypothetical protein TIFTF001_005472 [Ficus carica]
MVEGWIAGEGGAEAGSSGGGDGRDSQKRREGETMVENWIAG